ncbi:MAG TPA: tetratricopeptide repeat protein, partial [Pyrinomonadaceae bacterium]
SNLALALLGLKNWERAREASQKAIEIDRENVYYTQVLATVYNAEGNDDLDKADYAAAKANYDKAIELDQNAAVYYANLALALAGLNDWPGAREACQKAIDIEPENIDYRRKLAGIYNAEGNDHLDKADYAAAKANYDKAIELDPNAAVYYANLALALAGLDDWPGAREACQKAIDIEPENSDYRRTLAEIYKAEGNAYTGKADGGAG